MNPMNEMTAEQRNVQAKTVIFIGAIFGLGSLLNLQGMQNEAIMASVAYGCILFMLYNTCNCCLTLFVVSGVGYFGANYLHQHPDFLIAMFIK